MHYTTELLQLGNNTGFEVPPPTITPPTSTPTDFLRGSGPAIHASIIGIRIRLWLCQRNITGA